MQKILVWVEKTWKNKLKKLAKDLPKTPKYLSDT